MASKIQVAKFHDFTEGPMLDPTSSGVWNMEENDVVGQLKDESFKKRVEILEQLIITVKRNGGCLPYSDQESIFRGLGLALTDTNWEIRLKCIYLLQELIPSLQDSLDHCMSIVLNKLIANIGDSKVTLRKAVISNLHRYMKHTRNLPALLHAIVNTGLENEDPRVRRETICALPMLLTRDFIDANLYGIVQSLAKKLLDTSTEDNLKDLSLTTLESIEKLVGEDKFEVYIQKLSPSLRKYYHQLTGKHEIATDNQDHAGMYSARQTSMQGEVDRQDRYTDCLEFGIVPAQTMTHINDQKDFKTRAQAVEDLKGVVLSLTPHDINEKLIPNMLPFMSFLNSLLDDTNFKINTVTLEIVYSVVEHLGKGVKNYVKNIVNLLSKRMGDNKIVIRQSIMRVLMKMMQCYSPQMVLSVIFDYLSHRNSRVRQEIINFIIAALLTFPSYEFDLPSICMVVGPTLTDVKRQVRQAALECFAVLAQAMGSGRLQPLVQAVDQVELSSEGEGLMAAVQARLARRQLPRLNSDGLVEYATPVPTSATQRSSPASQSADTEWILAVGGGTVRTARSDIMELESVTSGSARSTPMTESSAPTPVPRRFMSAGRGRNKLPWEEDERCRAYEDMPNSAPAHYVVEEMRPPKPRPMWMEDGGSPEYRKGPKRLTTLDSLGIQNNDNESSGSYGKIYQRRQMVNGLRTNAFDGTGDMPDFTRDIKSEQRTPRTVLDPISNEEELPIPLKPALVRGSSTHRSNTRVPPITAATNGHQHDDDSDSAYSISSVPSQNGSVRGAGLRNSAKNKAQRLFDRIEKQESRQSLSSSPTDSDQAEESGIFSSSSSVNSIKRSPSRHNPAGTTGSEPVSKPKPSAYTSSMPRKRSDNLDVNENRHITVHLDYNPNSGVTFRENPNSDVQVVGRGYSDDSSSSMYEGALRSFTQQPQLNNRARDRRRTTKGSHLSSMGAPTVSPSSTSGATRLSPDSDKAGAGGEEEKDQPASRDKIALVGRGMFDSSAGVSEYPVSSSGMPAADKGERRRQDASRGNTVPTGVVGVAVRSTADLSATDGDTTTGEDDSEDDQPNLAKSFQRSVAHKQRLKKEQEEKARLERERENAERQQERENAERQQERENAERQQERENAERQRQQERESADRQRQQERESADRQRERERNEKLRQERERQQQKLKKLGSNDSLFVESLSISGSGPSSLNSTPNSPMSNSLSSKQGSTHVCTVSNVKATPKRPVPPVVTPRKIIKTSNEPVSIHPMPVVDRTSESTETPTEDWQPFTDPDASLRAAQKKLENDDWEEKTEGLNMIRRIVQFHPETFNHTNLHPVILAIVNEVKNLRSQVSRLAIVCLGSMFSNLKKGMDPDLDIVTRQLLAKAGESNNFIRDDVDQALSSMVAGVTPQRSLLALISGGAMHKNMAVRRTTAQFLVAVVERMGSGKILSGVKDVTDRVLPTAAQFCLDGSPETRFYGRNILWLLMAHHDFDRLLAKYLPANILRNIQEVVENLKSKGLGEKPCETSSAKARRSGHVSRMGSTVRGGSATSNAENGSTGTPPARPKALRLDEAAMDRIKTMINLLSSREWRDRFEAVNTLQEMCVEHPDAMSMYIIKIFDKFLPRLQDSNSKVNLHALKVMHEVVPMLKEALPSVISMAVASVVPNMSSKNREINLTATDILDSFMEHIDHSLLIQPFANQAQSATGQSKAEMVIKVAYLTDRVYDRKPKQIVLHVLPLLWHLLGAVGVAGGSMTGDLRTAIANLVSCLWGHMGQGLFDRANSNPNMTARHIAVLNEILNL